jgi:hypothetical protein
MPRCSWSWHRAGADPIGFDAAVLSEVPHIACYDALALRTYILAREGR